MVVAVGDVCFLKKSTESSLKETKAKKRKTLPAARKRSTLPYPCMQQQGFVWPRGGQQPASRSLPAVEGVRVAPEPNCPAQGLAQRLAPVTRFGHLLAELGQPPKVALRGRARHGASRRNSPGARGAQRRARPAQLPPRPPAVSRARRLLSPSQAVSAPTHSAALPTAGGAAALGADPSRRFTTQRRSATAVGRGKEGSRIQTQQGKQRGSWRDACPERDGTTGTALQRAASETVPAAYSGARRVQLQAGYGCD